MVLRYSKAIEGHLFVAVTTTTSPACSNCETKTIRMLCFFLRLENKINVTFKTKKNNTQNQKQKGRKQFYLDLRAEGYSWIKERYIYHLKCVKPQFARICNFLCLNNNFANEQGPHVWEGPLQRNIGIGMGLKPKVEDAVRALKRTEKSKNDSYKHLRQEFKFVPFNFHGEW